MPDAKFVSGSFSIFGDMTSQNFFQEKGTSHRFLLFTPGKWVEITEVSRIVILDPKLPPPPPHVNFSNFQPEENCCISKLF